MPHAWYPQAGKEFANESIQAASLRVGHLGDRPAPAALTAGHVLIRLTNPADAFDLRSATDWLHCHNAARQALADALGATRYTVIFAHQWHPIGAAIGEPEVESSTPTFHLFGRWDGAPVTPGEQLLLPTQRRMPVAPEDLLKYDDGLRAALRRSVVEHSSQERAAAASWHFAAVLDAGIATNCHLGEAPALASVPLEAAPLPELVEESPTAKAGTRHSVISPPRPGPSPHGSSLRWRPPCRNWRITLGFTGLSCVVPDPGAGPLEVHAVGRSAGESVNPLQEFLSLPGVNPALL